MMRWLAFVLLILSGPAYGQEINVRSGAHEGFARLVLDVPAGTEWTLDEEPGRARLVLSRHRGGFDTSNVFNRIDRTLISDVSADAESISVEFACACRARVFAQGPSMVVLDVLKDANSAAPPTRDEALAFVGQRPLRFAVTKAPARTEQPVIGDIPETVASKAAPDTTLPDGFPGISTAAAPSQPDTAALRKAQQELSREISGAATRGILAPAGRRIDLITSPAKPQIDTRIFDSSVTQRRPEPSAAPSSGNIRITSSFDIPRIGQDQIRSSTTLGMPCIDPAGVAVQDWGSDIGLNGRLAQLRGQLYGEFDRLDHDSALSLVKTYLHYGFGAEAKQILDLERGLSQTHPALIGIADIMEYGHSREVNFLGNFVDCDSDVALWAILSSPEIDPTRTINVKAALLSLSGLPMHLRSFIAPELSRRLLAYGSEAGAAAALRTLERGAEPLSANANLAKANLEMAQGDVEQAQNRLSEVVASNAEQSAEALITFVDSFLEEDSEIDEDVATLVEAYAMEMRDDPIGDELRRAHVLALGKSGQYSAAFEALSRVRARSSDMAEDRLRSSVLDLLTRSAPDIEFLDQSFEQMAIAPETILPDTRFRIADRLARLGFFEEAEVILAIAPAPTNTSVTALLRARIALALDRPHEALAHLYGESSQEGALLRAQAESRSGDFSQAHSIYTAIGDESNSRRSAWMSDSWSVLVEDAAPVFGPVVRVAQTPLDTTADLEGMLERAKNAISESAGARAVIEELLISNDLGTVDP